LHTLGPHACSLSTKGKGYGYQERYDEHEQRKESLFKHKLKKEKGNVSNSSEDQDWTMTDPTNELEDGSIIDLAGVFLLWQPRQKVQQVMNSCCRPKQVITGFNGLAVQCPVQLHSITFAFAPYAERFFRAIEVRFFSLIY
jgi:hypothetical protein